MNDNTTQPGSKPTPFLYAWLNGLIDSGAAASMPGTSLRVLLVLARHADRTGNTFPSPERIARKLGIGVRNVQRALRWLVANNRCTGGNAGAGRGHRFVRRLVVQEVIVNPAQCATFSHVENPAHGDAETRRPVARKPGAPRPGNPARCASRTELEGKTEENLNNIAAGGGGGPISQFFQNKNAGGAASQKYGTLADQRFTVTEQERLVNYASNGQNIRKPIAWLRSMLDNPEQPLDWDRVRSAENLDAIVVPEVALQSMNQQDEGAYEMLREEIKAVRDRWLDDLSLFGSQRDERRARNTEELAKSGMFNYAPHGVVRTGSDNDVKWLELERPGQAPIRRHKRNG